MNYSVFLKVPNSILAALAVALLPTCRTVRSNIKVVGGAMASEQDFPSAVFIPGCSATRVSQSILLTAAHCVVAENPNPSEPDTRKHILYQPGSAIRVAFGVKSKPAQSFIIEEIWVEPGYLEKFADESSLKRELKDVALIKLRNLPAQPLAGMSEKALEKQDLVIFTGFGCTEIPESMKGENTKTP